MIPPWVNNINPKAGWLPDLLLLQLRPAVKSVVGKGVLFPEVMGFDILDGFLEAGESVFFAD